jgi:hypothetical protein
MTKINKFFFFLGLFTVNAFRYKWKGIIISTLIDGLAMSLLFRDPWLFIPAFIGVYLGQIYIEYIDYKKVKNAQD